MAVHIKKGSVWDGVPKAEQLKEALQALGNPKVPTMKRQEAAAYLKGQLQVLRTIPVRHGLAAYLQKHLTEGAKK